MVDIRHLEWNTQSKVLFSVDASRRCIATRLTLPASTAVTTAAQKQQQQLQLQQFEHILDVRASDTVVQALISPDGTSFLVSTQTGEELHVPGEELYTTAQSTHSQGKARWLPHPTNPEQLLLFSNDSSALHIFSWKDLVRETPTQGIAITLPPSLGLAATAITLSDEWHSRPNLATLVQTMAMPNSSKTGFLTLDLSTITDPLSTTSIEIQCTARQLVSSQIKSVLGVYRSNLYFMSGRGWVCSISLKNLPGSKAYVRHFFIPSVWQTGGELIARVVSKTSVAMAYRDEVVVLQGFLEFEHKSLFGEGEGDAGDGRAVVPVTRAATS
jgi:hypothetical protein